MFTYAHRSTQVKKIFCVSGWLGMALLILGFAPLSRAQSSASSASMATPSGGADSTSLGKPEIANPEEDTGSPTVADPQLPAQIKQALGKVPELSNDSLQVSLIPEGLELTGSVETGRERQAAIRIAQSYAHGRKVVDHIVVSGRNTPSPDIPKTSRQASSQP